MHNEFSYRHHHLERKKQLVPANLRGLSLLCPLTVRLGSIVTLVHDQILGTVVVAAGEVRVEDRLCAGSVTLLSIDGGS